MQRMFRITIRSCKRSLLLLTVLRAVVGKLEYHIVLPLECNLSHQAGCNKKDNLQQVLVGIWKKGALVLCW